MATSNPNQMQQKDFVQGRQANYYVLSAADDDDYPIQQQVMRESLYSKARHSQSQKKDKSPRIDKTKYTFGKDSGNLKGAPLTLRSQRKCSILSKTTRAIRKQTKMGSRTCSKHTMSQRGSTLGKAKLEARVFTK